MTQTENRDAPERVAIVGMAGRLPGAANLDEFWRNLKNGVDSISRLDPESVLAAGASPDVVAGPDYVFARGLLADADLFDAPFFGFTPRDAETTDPQQRVLLEIAWEALESAGCDPGRYDGSVGVFAGCSLNTYLLANLMRDREALQRLVGEYQVGNYATIIGNDKDYLATRLSYKLNLRGPSVTVQCACSTSLAAVAQAVQSLIAGACDMALAGGVSITFPQERGYVYQEGAMVSPDGRCRPFDAQAAGTVFGSGGGLVVLKRLSDAIAAGDPVRAVILGCGMNNDGAQKVSYLAPSVDGQAGAIAAALRMAQAEPETIGYVEAHGTATPLGDPIEVAGLTKAYRDCGAGGSQYCALGSAKSNIGHLAEASGIAGLFKVVMALENEEIPASLHFHSPNPRIRFEDTPFYVASTAESWPRRSGSPRRAGVSSFGVGGTNVHLVVEEAPLSPPPAPAAPELLVLSARTPEALEAIGRRLSDHLTANPETGLADVAYTLQAGRKPFEFRRWTVAADPDAAVQALRAAAESVARSSPKSVGVAFLFPGQGSQHIDMARDIYEAVPCFRADVDACCERLIQHLGFDLRELLFPAVDAAAEAARSINETRFAQPALFTVEYALAMLWAEWGAAPDSLIGHSIGEYVAATLSGVFSLDDALKMVATRGMLMQNQLPGGMLAVRLPVRDVEALIGDRLSIAAVNSPVMTVVSGPDDEIDALEMRLQEKGQAARRLHTSHAFHSSLMEPMLPAFRKAFEGVSLGLPQIPFISNATGDWITDDEATDPEYWVRHVRSTVQFASGIETLVRDPERALIEAGPGNALTVLARQTALNRPNLIISSLDHVTAGGFPFARFKEAVGRAWAGGVEIDWDAMNAGRGRRIPLPAYPFERKRYWVEPVNAYDRSAGGYARIEGDLR